MASTRTLLAVALSLGMMYTACAAECGHQANDAVCLFGACCSVDGMCGRGDKFCGNGCQERAGLCYLQVVDVIDAAPVAECGRQAFDAVCLFGACCSKEGLCGRGNAFCGDGCQEGAGRCDLAHNQ